MTNTIEDAYNLQRFLDAQGESIETVYQELREGQKHGHWMWYIFPQIKGLGQTETSFFYGIGSVDEASAYLRHPILGLRLIHCTEAVNAHKDRSARQIFGHPDYLKFRSCMTLFEVVAGKNSPFSKALETFYGGESDARTLLLLNAV